MAFLGSSSLLPMIAGELTLAMRFYSPLCDARATFRVLAARKENCFHSLSDLLPSSKRRPIMSVVYASLFLLEWPLMTLRYISIPAADCGWGHSRRAILILTPPFALMLLLVELSGGTMDAALQQTVPGASHVLLWPPLVAAGVALSAFFMHATDPRKLPRWHAVLVLVGFVVTVAWLDLLANEVNSATTPPHRFDPPDALQLCTLSPLPRFALLSPDVDRCYHTNLV